MTRRVVTFAPCALCLAFLALAIGCGTKPQQTQPPLAQSTRAVAPPMRGENLFEKGETKYFPVRFIDKDAVTIHDKWTAEVAEDQEEDLGYYIGQERYDSIVALISHLDDGRASPGLDTETLAHGLVLIQDAAGEGRPDWQQDTTQLCIFAEFKNIDLWFRVPAEAATPETEHAYWLVRHTDPQASSEGASTDH